MDTQELTLADHAELWAKDRRVESYMRPIKTGTMIHPKWQDEPCDYLVYWDDGTRQTAHRFRFIRKSNVPERDTKAWRIMYEAWVDFAFADFPQ